MNKPETQAIEQEIKSWREAQEHALQFREQIGELVLVPVHHIDLLEQRKIDPESSANERKRFKQKVRDILNPIS